MCCFSAKHAALRRKSKDWLVRNQDNVYKWGDMSPRFHRALDDVKQLFCYSVWGTGPYTYAPQLFKDWLVRNQDNVYKWGDMTVVSVS
jgi:hypothetical protein